MMIQIHMYISYFLYKKNLVSFFIFSPIILLYYNKFLLFLLFEKKFKNKNMK